MFVEAIELVPVLVNLGLALVLGQVLSWHYLRFAEVLSNKRKFARVFVFIACTTFLIITVVKTSLALSLGLVGALSIIRFRTPIKEPEELAYLFLAIAVGVGLGADQSIATLIVFTVVLVYLGLRGAVGADRSRLRTVLQVTAKIADPDRDPSGATELDRLLPALRERCARVDLRRFDCDSGEVHASVLIELAGTDRLAGLLGDLQQIVPGAAVTVVERDGVE
jgi:hypothetical protein